MMGAAHPAYRPLVAGVRAAAVAVAALIGLPRWHYALLRLAVSPHWLRGLAVGLAQALRVSCAGLLRPRPLVSGVAIGPAAWAAQGYVLYIVARQFGIALEPATAVSVYALAILASVAVFFVPNGLGGTEAAMTALLVGFGAPLKLAIMATLLCQLSTLWLAVLLGMAAAAVLESGQPGTMARAPL